MILPLQYFGIGDVIFTQTLIHRIAGDRKIIWPVQEDFVEGLTRAYPTVIFLPQKLFKPEIFEIKTKGELYGVEVAPIRWGEKGRNYTDCMKAKYEMYDLDFRIWKECANWKPQKEEFDLFKWLALPAKYNLISSTFRSDHLGYHKIEVDNGYPNIELKQIPGFSLFDWRLVIEGAEEIHAVSSAILYLLELLDVGTVHLYPRLPEEKDFRNVDYLFTKPYILH